MFKYIFLIFCGKQFLTFSVSQKSRPFEDRIYFCYNLSLCDMFYGYIPVLIQICSVGYGLTD